MRYTQLPLIIGAALCISCVPSFSPPSEPPVENEGPPTLRLPTGTHVLAERLDLDIDPSRNSFHGVADIDLHLDRPGRSLWLHGRDLRVTRATVVSGTHTWEGRWLARPDAIASIQVPTTIPSGDVSLHVEYDADFMTSDVGVSRVTSNGRNYVFTQFAQIEARRAFPCFDEPGTKYPFTLALTIPSDTQAIANTSEDTRVPLAGNRVQVRFHKTPPLPAYLVAFAVGLFDIVRAPDIPPSRVRARPLSLRGIATPGRGNRLAYALKQAAAAVVALEDYFQQPFPFEKLDLIAVPDKTIAMENAGAITFGEQAVLLDEASTNESDRLYILRNVTHEISHQWLGDLVTMSWWDDTWLNEAFATWMSAKISERIDPTQRVDLLNLRAVDRAMTIDSREATRSVRQPIKSADDIANALDAISYDKGSSVLGMFERWMGPDTFRDGLRFYVASHAFGSATAEDLFAALSTASRRDVSGAFRTFIEQPGVPFVEVQVRCDSKPLAHLAQSRFAPLGSTIDPLAKWGIPVCLKYCAGTHQYETCSLLDTGESDVVLEACPDWIMPNAEAAGYYRYAMGHDALERTRKHLGALSTREVLSLASNLRAGLLRGSNSPADVFDAVAVLATDSRPEVVDEAVATLSLPAGWLFGDPALGAFEAYAKNLFQPSYVDLGWEPREGTAEGRGEQLRRATAIKFLARVARDPGVRREASSRALRFLGFDGDGRIHREALQSEVAGTALAVAAEDGGERVFDAMLAHLQHTDDAHIRSMLIDAFAAYEKPALAQRARDLALSGSLRGSEPQWIVLMQIVSPHTRDDAWKWLRANSDALLASSKEATARLWVMNSAGYMCDDARTAEVVSYLDQIASKVEGGPRAAASAGERSRLCGKQRAALLPATRKFFVEHAPSSAAVAAKGLHPRAPTAK